MSTRGEQEQHTKDQPEEGDDSNGRGQLKGQTSACCKFLRGVPPEGLGWWHGRIMWQRWEDGHIGGALSGALLESSASSLLTEVLAEELVQRAVAVRGEVNLLRRTAVVCDHQVWVVVANPFDLHVLVLVNPALLFEKPFDLWKCVEPSRWARQDLAAGHGVDGGRSQHTEKDASDHVPSR